MRQQLERLDGVHWATVNDVVGRVLVGIDDRRVSAEVVDRERVVGNLHRAYADLAVPVGARGGPIDFLGALADMVTYNGGRPLTCLA